MCFYDSYFQHFTWNVPRQTTARPHKIKLRRHPEVRNPLAGRQPESVGALGMVDSWHDGILAVWIQLRE